MGRRRTRRARLAPGAGTTITVRSVPLMLCGNVSLSLARCRPERSSTPSKAPSCIRRKVRGHWRSGPATPSLGKSAEGWDPATVGRHTLRKTVATIVEEADAAGITWRPSCLASPCKRSPGAQHVHPSDADVRHRQQGLVAVHPRPDAAEHDTPRRRARKRTNPLPRSSKRCAPIIPITFAPTATHLRTG